MGVVVSTHSTTSPFFLTSGIIGFVSFAFTVGTFVRVLWVNFETLGEAPHEVHSYLTNLRTELLEERANLKVMKKNCKKHHKLMEKAARGQATRIDSGVELDDVTLKTMSDTVRHLIKQFKEIERPFLEPGEHGIADATSHRKRRRSRSVSPYANSAYNSPPEKAHSRSRTNHDRYPGLPRYADEVNDDEDDRFWAQRTQYANFGFWKRMKWLYKKPQAQQLFQTLSRLQIRRIAKQVGGLSVLMHEYGTASLEMHEAVRRIDERMGRFVGARRVDE